MRLSWGHRHVHISSPAGEVGAHLPISMHQNFVAALLRGPNVHLIITTAVALQSFPTWAKERKHKGTRAAPADSPPQLMTLQEFGRAWEERCQMSPGLDRKLALGGSGHLLASFSREGKSTSTG